MMNDSAMCAKLPAFCLLFSVPVIQVGFCKFLVFWPATSFFFARVPGISLHFSGGRGGLYTARVGPGQGRLVVGLLGLIWQIYLLFYLSGFN